MRQPPASAGWFYYHPVVGLLRASKRAPHLQVVGLKLGSTFRPSEQPQPGTYIVPLKWIEYGVYGDLIFIPKAIFNLLKGDYVLKKHEGRIPKPHSKKVRLLAQFSSIPVSVVSLGHESVGSPVSSQGSEHAHTQHVHCCRFCSFCLLEYSGEQAVEYSVYYGNNPFVFVTKICSYD